MTERDCKLVSSRGILKSCAIHSATPISSIKQLIGYDFTGLQPGSTIYVCGSAVPHFVRSVRVPVPYILVSGDCDESVPTDLFSTNDEFLQFINSPNLIRWFSQNCVFNTHPKLLQIPIGLDYHTMAASNHAWGAKTSSLDQEQLLMSVKSKAKPWSERIPIAYSNHHFIVDRVKFGADRSDSIKHVPKELVMYESTQIPRLNAWHNQSKYAFVISPHGNGLDCHRTWEALALGCIPIVKSSPLDPLYADLPVLIVSSWSDVTQELLTNTLCEYSAKTFNWDKLTLQYWVAKITDQTEPHNHA